MHLSQFFKGLIKFGSELVCSRFSLVGRPFFFLFNLLIVMDGFKMLTCLHSLDLTLVGHMCLGIDLFILDFSRLFVLIYTFKAFPSDQISFESVVTTPLSSPLLLIWIFYFCQ